jgi:hypothetical protein
MADLMVKLQKDRVPGPVMDALMRKDDICTLMRVCEDAGLHVTVVVTPAGEKPEFK